MNGMYLPYELNADDSYEYSMYMADELNTLLRQSDSLFIDTWKNNASFVAFLDSFVQHAMYESETTRSDALIDAAYRAIKRGLELGHTLSIPQWLDFCSLYGVQSKVVVDTMHPLLMKWLDAFRSELLCLLDDVSSQLDTQHTPDKESLCLLDDTVRALCFSARSDPVWWSHVCTLDVLARIVWLYESKLMRYHHSYTSSAQYGLLTLFDLVFDQLEFEAFNEVVEIATSEEGMFLSDWNYMFNTMTDDRIRKRYRSIDCTRTEYLLTILSQLPRREVPSLDSVPVESIASASAESPARLRPRPVQYDVVQRVKDIFPDLKDDVIAACIERHDGNVEQTIHSLLEGESPPEAALDRDKMWVGKKSVELKCDTSFVSTQRQIMLRYDYEDDLYSSNEYDDDYNDEFDDYIPFGVNDNPAADLEEVKAQNTAMRAKEAEEKFWESMKNPNYSGSLAERSNATSATPSSDEKVRGTGTATATTTTAAAAAAESQQIEKKTPRSKTVEEKVEVDNKSGKGQDKKEYSQRQKAYRSKNKAKLGNHNRKDRAVKKQG